MTSRKKRKICTVLVDRANYGRLWPVMKELKSRKDVELQTVCAGTMLLERFGQAEKLVEKDGFSVNSRVYLEVEGSVPATMSKSIGLGVIEFTNEFLRLQPDVVLLIGDRYEALAAALAASFMNFPLAHIQGGEVSGSIDESTRHAITKFANVHFPATERSAKFIRMMGESKERVFMSGCPSGDYIIPLDTDLPANFFRKQGVGASFDASEDFILVIYHPITTRFGQERSNAQELIDALESVRMPTVWLWPNIDAGADDISKALRVYREHHANDWLHLIKNLDPISYQKCLKKAACAVGNSSSFVRDSTFSGTPVVLVGDRQEGREYGPNLIAVKPEKNSIEKALRDQLSHGRYEPSGLYGKGNASKIIADVLTSQDFGHEKRLSYLDEQ